MKVFGNKDKHCKFETLDMNGYRLNWTLSPQEFFCLFLVCPSTGTFGNSVWICTTKDLWFRCFSEKSSKLNPFRILVLLNIQISLINPFLENILNTMPFFIYWVYCPDPVLEHLLEFKAHLGSDSSWGCWLWTHHVAYLVTCNIIPSTWTCVD